MAYLIGFVAGAAAYYLYVRAVRFTARRVLDQAKYDEKTIRSMLFAKMSYDSLLRVKAALEAEIAKRREPLDG